MDHTLFAACGPRTLRGFFGKLLCEIVQRIERVAGIEAFLVLTVAALHLTVVPRGNNPILRMTRNRLSGQRV